ncbi:hypothetical protein ElyMa_004377800 [Elysia marginata]|uniref:Receptor ligand binding region domain-containing protein n=1 Tax=Elysia marginata TaxID=1093978 RepID=A0AAV4H9K2_9GAST|nr:hypothetical protein ElyMa_004377800 [Elysia marginata]
MFGVVAASSAAVFLSLFVLVLLVRPAVLDISNNQQHHKNKYDQLAGFKQSANITAVFEQQDVDDFRPVFERTISELKNRSHKYYWGGKVILAKKDLRDMVTQLCTYFQGDRSHLRLIVVFGRVETVQTVNLISEALGIPVIGYMLDKGDGYVQITTFSPPPRELQQINPFYSFPSH